MHCAKSWRKDPLLAESVVDLPEQTITSARAALRNEARAVETEIKFAGYLDQQKKSIEKLKAAEAVTIPEWIEYGAISGLSREMRETLERVRPITIGQASRIPGVTPAALSLVHVSIRLQGANVWPATPRLWPRPRPATNLYWLLSLFENSGMWKGISAVDCFLLGVRRPRAARCAAS